MCPSARRLCAAARASPAPSPAAPQKYARASQPLPTATVKAIVVGNGGVGKSSMTARYCKGVFTSTYKKTIGARADAARARGARAVSAPLTPCLSLLTRAPQAWTFWKRRSRWTPRAARR